MTTNTLPTIVVKLSTGESVELELVDFERTKKVLARDSNALYQMLEVDNPADYRHTKCLDDNEESIPEEWRQYVLVFPGTRRRSSTVSHEGDRETRVAVLKWLPAIEKWFQTGYWTGVHEIINHGRLVRCKS